MKLTITICNVYVVALPILHAYINGVVFTCTDILTYHPATNLINSWPVIFAMKHRACEKHHAEIQPL
jgi:hypothetical protein